MGKSTTELMQELRVKNLNAVAKADKAESSKIRAQKTLTKARQAEKVAVSARELSWTKMQLLCAENQLDFEKTIKETDDTLVLIAEGNNNEISSD